MIPLCDVENITFHLFGKLPSFKIAGEIYDFVHIQTFLENIDVMTVKSHADEMFGTSLNTKLFTGGCV